MARATFALYSDYHHGFLCKTDNGETSFTEWITCAMVFPTLREATAHIEENGWTNHTSAKPENLYAVEVF